MQHRAQQQLARTLDSSLELGFHNNAEKGASQAGLLDSYRPFTRISDTDFAGSYSHDDDNVRQRDVPTLFPGYDAPEKHEFDDSAGFRNTRHAAGQRNQSCSNESKLCEHLSLMQQAMNDSLDHDTELASVRQQLAEKEAQILSLQEKLKDSESRELDRARNMRWWMERALKYKLDYELDSDVFHKTQDQFSRMFEAVDIARRESSTAQQEVIALSRETGEYYKIIREILKDPTSIDADSIHDRMAKCLTLTRRAQQERT